MSTAHLMLNDNNNNDDNNNNNNEINVSFNADISF